MKETLFASLIDGIVTNSSTFTELRRKNEELEKEAKFLESEIIELKVAMNAFIMKFDELLAVVNEHDNVVNELVAMLEPQFDVTTDFLTPTKKPDTKLN